MKAIAIKQPWVDRILSGQKTVEIRSWKTKHRGDIYITCSKVPVSKLAGKAVAIVHIDEVVEMSPLDEKLSGVKYDKRLFSWRFSRLRKVHPFSVKNKLGVFDIIPLET